ncbi:MAG: protein kinase [Candidatus Eisenbacteria bacterium]
MKRGSIDDPERWRRARAIFEAALELDPTARGAHLDRECGDDVSLRAEVLDLLAADAALAERTGTSEPGFLEETAASLVSLLETSRATAQRGSAGAGSTLSLPQLPFSWGPLTVEEQIGEGSFGRVFRAHDPTLRRDVALKLRPLDATGRTVDGEDHLEEARRLARLRHPNVIVVHGAEAHDGWAGIWTDLVPGEALDVALERGGPFSRESLLRVGLDLCRALRAVHGAGLVHGDVKTSNAMRDADGRVLLMDFGSGRSASDATDDDSPASERLPQQGTPVAMAPELFDGATPTPISDVYALGVLLYRLATGRYPIQARSVREQVARLRQERPIPLEEMRPDLPAGFARVVHRALSVDPTARPSSAADFEWQLAASLGAEDVEFAESDGASDSLPHYPTRFIGRATELRQLRALLAEPGVVTLVGAGGCGKTRVTTRVAREFQQTMGGVLWVDLAPLTAADDLLVAVARVAEVRDEAARSLLDAVGDRLREMGNLLVLDNAEHLVAEVGRLIETLRSVAPRLRILVTSRRRLAIKEERSCQLAPMSAPDANQAEAGRALLEWDAVRLFVDRARVGGEPLRLNPAATADVARIVRRVDGIPLAIEMAAARVATLGLGTVATKLEESFRLLRTRAAGAQRHHETLEASIAWSVQFLSGEEAALLRRLSVFAGGASLDAIEEVCADRESADLDDRSIRRDGGSGDRQGRDSRSPLRAGRALARRPRQRGSGGAALSTARIGAAVRRRRPRGGGTRRRVRRSSGRVGEAGQLGPRSRHLWRRDVASHGLVRSRTRQPARGAGAIPREGSGRAGAAQPVDRVPHPPEALLVSPRLSPGGARGIHGGDQLGARGRGVPRHRADDSSSRGGGAGGLGQCIPHRDSSPSPLAHAGGDRALGPHNPRFDLRVPRGVG